MGSAVMHPSMHGTGSIFKFYQATYVHTYVVFQDIWHSFPTGSATVFSRENILSSAISWYSALEHVDTSLVLRGGCFNNSSRNNLY